MQAHGHTESAHCVSCNREFDSEKMKQHIREGMPAYCECGSVAKPDIVFFGEQLPSEFP